MYSESKSHTSASRPHTRTTTNKSRTYQNGPGPICTALSLRFLRPLPPSALLLPVASPSSCPSCRRRSRTNARYRPNRLRCWRPAEPVACSAVGEADDAGSTVKDASDGEGLCLGVSETSAWSSGAAKSAKGSAGICPMRSVPYLYDTADNSRKHLKACIV